MCKLKFIIWVRHNSGAHWTKGERKEYVENGTAVWIGDPEEGHGWHLTGDKRILTWEDRWAVFEDIYFLYHSNKNITCTSIL